MEPLHPLAEGFADVADAYERGRPECPPEVIAAMADALGLAPGARVLDLGAGTGMFTRPLVAAGFAVTAVEPLPAMRERLAALDGVTVLDGRAEAIPAPDGAFDAVAVADAFHWFDGPRAAVEIHRVLAGRGGLALMWRMPSPGDQPPWAIELGQLLDELRPPHPGFTADRGAGALDDRFESLGRRHVDHEHRTDRGGLVAAVASMSFVGVMDADRRDEVLHRVDELLARHGIEETIGMLRAELWLYRAR